jgi:hypothetical protein
MHAYTGTMIFVTSLVCFLIVHIGLLAEWVIAFMHMSNYYYYYYYSFEKYIVVNTRHIHSRQQSNDGTQRRVANVT